MHNTLFWPECFITGVIPEDVSDTALCGYALCAWGGVYLGKEAIPEHFGTVMAEITMKLGISGTPESFKEYAKKYLLENK